MAEEKEEVVDKKAEEKQRKAEESTACSRER